MEKTVSNDNGKSNSWLINYSKNITSQSGEDGIFEKVFEIIKGNKWCVEFGAWDGKLNSNTYNLVVNKGWSGILLEASKKRFKELTNRYKNNPRVQCLNKLVNFSGKNSLDELLKKTNIPLDFDLLSIDVDGNDYHIWHSLKNYSPKVVIIEFNHVIPNDISFIQKRKMSINQGSSILSITKLAKKKNYELIITTFTNAIFVKREFYDLFEIRDNSIVTFRDDSRFQTRMFQLYDGTLVLNGFDRLLWHGRKKIDQRRIQVIPRILRKYPENYTRFDRILLKIWEIIMSLRHGRF